MTIQNADPMVSADWLKANISAPDLRVIDATWFLPGTSSDASAREGYDAAHIPGAVFFDIDEIADATAPLPRTLPNSVQFSSKVRKLGIGDGNRLIVYDRNGFKASARVWWMLRTMGVEDVRVLDGGFDAWSNAGGEVDDLPTVAVERHFTPRLRSDLLKTLDQMETLVADGSADIIDARAPDRFSGNGSEPRADSQSGHMPGARNVPAGTVINADGTMKSPDALRDIFGDLGGSIVTTCGSGVTACVLALALARLGRDDVAVYDGSWAEWASDPDRAIATAS